MIKLPEENDEPQPPHPKSSSLSISIVPINPDEHLPGIRRVLKDGFRLKRCCGCLPATESLTELQQRYHKFPPSKLALGAVAISTTSRIPTVLGYVQMTGYKDPTCALNFHRCARNELYIENIAVSTEARGMGIGGRLLQWCQDTAIHMMSITKLSLEVLRGNARAIALYERFGFKEVVATKQSSCSCRCDALLSCCFMGRPYGYCHPEWGSILMEKELA